MHLRNRVAWAGPFFGLLFACATNALADEADVQPTVEAKPATVTSSTAGAEAADPKRVVCRSMAVTGTRIVSRQCKPASEWGLLTRKSQESLDGLQRSGDMQHQHSN
jgi:hypothetical protein